MSPSQNRGFLRLDEIGTHPFSSEASMRAYAIPKGWHLRSEIDTGFNHGFLIENEANGNFAMFTVEGAVKSVDQRKIFAALGREKSKESGGAQTRKPPQSEKQKQEIADMMRRWMKNADLSTKTAAVMLGLSDRTLEGVLQGRGFVYPLLLTLAILSFESTPNHKSADKE